MTNQDTPRGHLIARFWDERAKRYDEHYDESSIDRHALVSRLEVARRMLGAGAGRSVLDAGLGPGRLSAALNDNGWIVYGADLSPQMVNLARTRVPEAEDRFVCASVESLPFADGTFDAVVATGVLEYTDISAALTELNRVLRESGLAVVSFPNPKGPFVRWKGMVWYRLVRRLRKVAGLRPETPPKGAGAISSETFRQLLRSRGFSVNDVRYTSYLPLPAPLDGLFPRTTARFGRWLEERSPWLGAVVGTQIVYAARLRSSSDVE